MTNNKLIEKLKEYEQEHSDLDQILIQLQEKHTVDFLQIQRLKKRKSLNRYDQFNINFYNKVQKGFIKLSKLNKKSYKIIDSNLDIKKNEDLVINQIKKLIK